MTRPSGTSLSHRPVQTISSQFLTRSSYILTGNLLTGKMFALAYALIETQMSQMKREEVLSHPFLSFSPYPALSILGSYLLSPARRSSSILDAEAIPITLSPKPMRSLLRSSLFSLRRSMLGFQLESPQCLTITILLFFPRLKTHLKDNIPFCCKATSFFCCY